jgi:hypothetical protein
MHSALEGMDPGSEAGMTSLVDPGSEAGMTKETPGMTFQRAWEDKPLSPRPPSRGPLLL